jgi:hypothetical protein
MTAQIIPFRPRRRRPADAAAQMVHLAQVQADVATAGFVVAINVLRALYGLPPLDGGAS